MKSHWTNKLQAQVKVDSGVRRTTKCQRGRDKTITEPQVLVPPANIPALNAQKATGLSKLGPINTPQSFFLQS